MIEGVTSGSKLILDGESSRIRTIERFGVVLKRTKVSEEEEVFFRVMKDIQGLDIILSLQNLDCYTLPHRSMFYTLNLPGLFQKLASRKTMYEELVTQRKFKKIFGVYGNKIAKLCFSKSNRDFSEKRYSESMIE